MATYSVPAAAHSYEFEIKRSQFICYSHRASHKAQAEQFIRDIRNQHPQARHVCWAYIAGAPNTTVMSMSDDGEPSGTAGRPMLNILQHSGLGEIVVAVVRYFGGIKLGTGGLQRAYSDAVSGVLATQPTEPMIAREKVSMTYDYAQEAIVRHVLSRYDTEQEQQTFADQVTMTCWIAIDDIERCQVDLTNQSAGRILLERVPTLDSERH